MPSRRLVLAARVALAIGAVALYRWPWPSPVDLTDLREQVEALDREVTAARATTDPAAGYVPRAPGPIADLNAPAVDILRHPAADAARLAGLETAPKQFKRLLTAVNGPDTFPNHGPV
jgi:hypothetical protein